mgnify:FL=1|tara:strand:- start:154 stop:426 length:273 start_codon:yes stop_codon:yes gene_type:complete
MVALFGGQPFLSMSHIRAIRSLVNVTCPKVDYSETLNHIDGNMYRLSIDLDLYGITQIEFATIEKELTNKGYILSPTAQKGLLIIFAGEH